MPNSEKVFKRGGGLRDKIAAAAGAKYVGLVISGVEIKLITKEDLTPSEEATVRKVIEDYDRID